MKMIFRTRDCKRQDHQVTPTNHSSDSHSCDHHTVTMLPRFILECLPAKVLVVLSELQAALSPRTRWPSAEVTPISFQWLSHQHASVDSQFFTVNTRPSRRALGVINACPQVQPCDPRLYQRTDRLAKLNVALLWQTRHPRLHVTLIALEAFLNMCANSEEAAFLTAHSIQAVIMPSYGPRYVVNPHIHSYDN